MRKALTFLLIIIVSSLIAGIYGILHDQLTFSISSEYYTKFKFYQFGLVAREVDVVFANQRLLVSVVGFMATWWVGLIIGFVLGLIGLIQRNAKHMFYVTIRAMLITICIAFIMALIGLAYGKFYLAKVGVEWQLPVNLMYPENFIAVGSMHNFSYLGGLIGLIAGVIFSIRKKQKYVATSNFNP